MSRRLYRRLLGPRWTLVGAFADPVDHRHARVIVPPAASPATLMLAALSPSRWTESDAEPLAVPVNPSLAILRQLVVPDREGDHRLWITSGFGDVLLLPLDTMLAERLTAALRLCRRLEGKPSGAPAAGPSPYQQHRHLLL